MMRRFDFADPLEKRGHGRLIRNCLVLGSVISFGFLYIQLLGLVSRVFSVFTFMFFTFSILTSIYYHVRIKFYSVRGEKEKKNAWPTEVLEKTIEKNIQHITKEDDVAIDWVLPKGIRDVTTEGKNSRQLLFWMPMVRLVGVDLWFERFFTGRFATWGGMFARILEFEPPEERGTKKRCLQYIYIYTRQVGTVSLVWWVLVPILLSLWLLLFPWMEWWNGCVIFLPLPLLTLWGHYTDPTDRFRVHSTSLLPLIWGFLFLRAWNLRIWGIELPIMCLLIFASVFSCVWLLDRFELLPTGHEMDYIPVFVWLSHREDAGSELGFDERENRILRNAVREIWDWEFDSIAWDVQHYIAQKKTRSELDEMAKKRKLDSGGYLKFGRHVRLLIDNQWHSLRVSGPRVGGDFIEIVARLMIPITPFIYLIPWSSLEFPLNLFGVIIFPIIFVSTLIFMASGHFKIHPNAEWLANVIDFSPTSIMSKFLPNIFSLSGIRYLDDKKLRYLWNLEQKESRLVVITKLQDPFKYEDSFLTFRDNLDDIYSEVKRLQWDEDVRKVKDIIDSQGIRLHELIQTKGQAKRGRKISDELLVNSNFRKRTGLSESRLKAIAVHLLEEEKNLDSKRGKTQG